MSDPHRRHGKARTAGQALGDVHAYLESLGVTIPDLPDDGSPPFRVDPPPEPPRLVSRDALEKSGWPQRALDEAEAADPRRNAITQLDNDGDAEGIVILSGIPGCGKTVAAARWALQATRSARFMRAAEFARSSRYEAEDRAALFACRRMCLDDLGGEYIDVKGSFLVDLDELIDLFYSDRRRLVITTNLTNQDFKDRYGARINDRLGECGRWIRVTDRSMRIR